MENKRIYWEGSQFSNFNLNLNIEARIVLDVLQIFDDLEPYKLILMKRKQKCQFKEFKEA